jgi:glycosyltransferase involved in cell wall biosynthesis
MKIILVNNHYFLHGGPDRYLFNIKQFFVKNGDTVIPFCFNYDESFESNYKKYFPTPISGSGTYLLENMHLNLLGKYRYATKLFYNKEVEHNFIDLLHSEKPDLIYSIYLSSSLLPKIFQIAKYQFGIPIIYRLSDFHMLCASYLFFRDGKVCTECIANPYNSIKHRCVKNSLLASCFRAFQMRMISKRNWYDSIDQFICPSKLMQSYLIESGFPEQKVKHVPTFADDLACKYISPRSHILYFGRISKEKGVEILLDAYCSIENPKLPLLLVGYCTSAYHQFLLNIITPSHKHLVHISPQLNGDALWKAVRDAAFVVHPAICLENLPNTLIESLSIGKAIVASDIGSLRELVANGENGLLVPPADTKALADAMEAMYTSCHLEMMEKKSRELYESNHTQKLHMERLFDIILHATQKL